MPKIPIEVIYMQVAYQFAKLSYATRRKVGCVIVKDKQVISFGYNGTPHGFDNSCENINIDSISVSYEKNPDIINMLEDDGYVCDNECCKKTTYTTKREVLHAESNAIMKVAKSTVSCEGADLYTTTCPCFDCAKLIIQAGISKVYYTEDYRDMSGVELLKTAGVEVEQVIVWNEF
jgi:dCMP deaminase